MNFLNLIGCGSPKKYPPDLFSGFDGYDENSPENIKKVNDLMVESIREVNEEKVMKAELRHLTLKLNKAKKEREEALTAALNERLANIRRTSRR